MTGAREETGGDRLGELFERAVEFPPEARAAFLEEACGDDSALYAEVSSLLSSHTVAPDFLDAIREDVLAPALADCSGRVLPDGPFIGRYEIPERVGSGGMVAEPLQRGIPYRRLDSW